MAETSHSSLPALTIATVLKAGPEYRPEYLYLLADSILKHNPGANIVCLTDMDISHPRITAIPLIHGWEGWWSKIELFRPGMLTGPVLYMDIDTVVVGKIPKITPSQLTMLPDVYYTGRFGSGVMAWNGGYSHIYKAFKKAPKKYMAEYMTKLRWGDQAFISEHCGHKPDPFRHEFRSYKAHCRHGIPHGTKVVYFHGEPRPWKVWQYA